MKVIGIVGSRRRNTMADFDKVVEAFDRVYRSGDRLVSGGCLKGADHVAEMLHYERSIPIKVHYPDKAKLNQELLAVNPKAAYAQINYARNELIARDADVLIACVAKDRKGGTEDTIRRFKKKCKELGVAPWLIEVT
jgi:hypothetical protein